MSEFHVRVVPIEVVEPHEKADLLEIVHIGGKGGYPCIIRRGEFKPGDKAVYVPAGALLDLNDPRWTHLRKPGSTKTHHELEPIRLRGVFSMGILTPADPAWEVGCDVAAELRIIRAEPPEPDIGNERDPGLMPTYTDIAGLRAHPSILREGEQVIITEKIHGESARFTFGLGRLWCGSRTAWKDPAGYPAGGVLGAPTREWHWWEVARRLGLEDRLRNYHQDLGIYGEVFGDVAGMKYGRTSDQRGLVLFDAINTRSRTYFDYDDFVVVANELGLPMAPILYRGPWSNDLRSLAEGNSTLAAHMREGIVIRPERERFDPTIGRVILKLHGEQFSLRAKK